MLLSSAALAGSGPSLAQAHDGGRGDKHGGHHGHHWRGHHDRGLARTAAKLGVTKDQLKTAMKAVREQQQAASRPAAYKDLVAQQLGVTTDQLKTAYKTARENAQSKEQFEQAFAAALGKDTATVEAAFKAAGDQLKTELSNRRDAFITALAAQLNLPVEKVDEAFTKSCGFKSH